MIELEVYACSQCGYELVASQKSKCPYCELLLTASAYAGEIESPWGNRYA